METIKLLIASAINGFIFVRPIFPNIGAIPQKTNVIIAKRYG